MAIASARLDLIGASGEPWLPRQVFLFSGHMVDAPGRNPPRFPAHLETAAAEKITETLDGLQADEQDLALTQGACGGDILFAEACLQRAVKLRLLQPFEQTAFIEKSVLPGGGRWLERYRVCTSKLERSPLAAPRELGPIDDNLSPYERCNLWLLASAMAYGTDKVRFLCLWDGSGGDGPGGTAHMVGEVRKSSGKVIWLDTRKLG